MPFSGIGYTSSDNPWGDGIGTHVGVRYLLSANAKQSYGVEVSYLDLYALDDGGPDVRYTAIGIVIEQTLWDWFLMSVGTVGYIGIGDNDDNPFGVRTNLGWVSNNASKVNPFIVYRTDLIFDDPSVSMNSLSAGIKITY